MGEEPEIISHYVKFDDLPESSDNSETSGNSEDFGDTQSYFEYLKHETKKKGIYELNTLIKDKYKIVAACLGERNDIVMIKQYQEGTNNMEITSLSLEDGTESVMYSEQLDDERELEGNLQILNVNPLITYDITSKQLEVYSSDFMEKDVVVNDAKGTCSVAYDDDSGCVYYENEDIQRVKKVSVSEMTVWSNANSKTGKFEFFANDVCKSPKGTQYMTLIGISEDYSTLQFSSWDEYLKTYVLLDYDIESSLYTHKYIFKDNNYPYWKNADNSKIIFKSNEYKYPVYFYTDGEANMDFAFDTAVDKKIRGKEVRLEMNKFCFKDGRAVMLFKNLKDNTSYLYYWDLYKSEMKKEYKVPKMKLVEGEKPKTQKISDTSGGANILGGSGSSSGYSSSSATADIGSIEEKYGIQILTGNDFEMDVEGYMIDNETRKSVIDSALITINSTLSMYPDGFIQELASQDISGIQLYLSGKLRLKNSSSNVLAVTFEKDGFECIVLDINDKDLKNNLVHEMCHAIDNVLDKRGKLNSLENKWSRLNPSGFRYSHKTYGFEQDIEYTAGDSLYWENNNAERVYFYDPYAKTDSKEDRARVMEFFIDYDNLDLCYESSHMQKKAKLYLDTLKENFKSFKNASKGIWIDTYRSLEKDGRIVR